MIEYFIIFNFYVFIIPDNLRGNTLRGKNFGVENKNFPQIIKISW